MTIYPVLYLNKLGFLYSLKQKHVALPLMCTLISIGHCSHTVYATLPLVIIGHFHYLLNYHNMAVCIFKEYIRNFGLWSHYQTYCLLFAFLLNSSQCWVHAVHSEDSCESAMDTWGRLGYHGASDCTPRMFLLPSKISVTIH